MLIPFVKYTMRVKAEKRGDGTTIDPEEGKRGGKIQRTQAEKGRHLEQYDRELLAPFAERGASIKSRRKAQKNALSLFGKNHLLKASPRRICFRMHVSMHGSSASCFCIPCARGLVAQTNSVKCQVTHTPTSTPRLISPGPVCLPGVHRHPPPPRRTD